MYDTEKNGKLLGRLPLQRFQLDMQMGSAEAPVTSNTCCVMGIKPK